MKDISPKEDKANKTNKRKRNKEYNSYLSSSSAEIEVNDQQQDDDQQGKDQQRKEGDRRRDHAGQRAAQAAGVPWSAVKDIIEWFQRAPGITAPHIDTGAKDPWATHVEKWIDPIVHLLTLNNGDVRATKRLIKEAVTFLGENRYTYKWPSSVRKTAVRIYDDKPEHERTGIAKIAVPEDADERTKAQWAERAKRSIWERRSNRRLTKRVGT